MTPKEEMIDKLQRALSKEIEFIRQNSSKTTDEKVVQVDILLDTKKFLKDYDENVKVLNKHIEDKKFEGR